MGEVVVSSEDMVSMEADAPRNHSGESCRGVVNWERFLPRRVLRVLLIEADDSTRQIIAALLRKCCYKVIAVPDGLKAWEILKGRPRAIDFILTEVDLPSISGFALLTLIMEHDVCKKIPVIMMSSKDSISTVYKCMTRGAADYLVKPVRINELKNLWQHVWRRQMVNLTNGQQHETAAMQKVEATAENDATSNLSSGNGDKELTEKGSNAQSSCTKPDVDPDIAEIEQNPDYNVNEMKTLMPEAVRSSDAKVTTVASDCNDMTIDSYREAINLIGAFDNSPRSIYMDYSWNYGTKQSDEQPELGLSLRQFDPSCITNQKYELKHSDASAFSRYVTKPLGSPQSGSVNLQGQDQDQEFARITDNPQERVCPAPILVGGIRFDSYGSQTGPSPSPTPSTTTRLEPLLRFDSSQQSSCENNNFDCCSDPHDQNASNSSNQYQIRQAPDLKFEPFEERGQISPATDGSASSSVCNGGSVTHLNSMDSGSVCASNGNVNQVPDTSQRSIQREAALAKFRLKRKDRCFEKKVRYESRKKLAEKRPRVKGQFVRQFALEETNL